jgi:hypothetical protein
VLFRSPVAGSGSSLLAALNTNRSSYGFEIKKDFFDKATKWINIEKKNKSDIKEFGYAKSELEKESLPVCVSVGYLYSVKNKITRLFADYSLKDGEIDEVGNTTLIPNSVIIDVKKV